MFSFLLFNALLSCGVVGAANEAGQTLTFDSNRRLSRNSILYQDSAYCRKKIEDVWTHNNPYSDARNFIPMSSAMLQGFVDSDAIPADVSCAAVCVDTGLAEDLISYPLPFYTYSETTAEKEGELSVLTEKCKAAEVGFISYYPDPVRLYWLNLKGKRIDVGTLLSGERNTIWQKSFLGHTFEICDKETDELLHRYTVMHHAHVVVGHEHHAKDYNSTVQKTFDFNGVSKKVKQAMSSEWDKSNHVTRTFTPLGFSKGKLPNDVWGSISAYNYNNKHNGKVALRKHI